MDSFVNSMQLREHTDKAHRSPVAEKRVHSRGIVNSERAEKQEDHTPKKQAEAIKRNRGANCAVQGALSPGGDGGSAPAGCGTASHKRRCAQ